MFQLETFKATSLRLNLLVIRLLEIIWTADNLVILLSQSGTGGGSAGP